MGLPSASSAMLATNAIFMGLAIVAVILRIYVRLRHNPPLYIDDYLIFLALVSSSWKKKIKDMPLNDLLTHVQLCSVALALTDIIGVPLGGFGAEFTTLTPTQQTHFFKVSKNKRPSMAVKQQEENLHTQVQSH